MLVLRRRVIWHHGGERSRKPQSEKKRKVSEDIMSTSHVKHCKTKQQKQNLRHLLVYSVSLYKSALDMPTSQYPCTMRMGTASSTAMFRLSSPSVECFSKREVSIAENSTVSQY